MFRGIGKLTNKEINIKWLCTMYLEDDNDNPVCKTAKETQMYRTVFWTLWERARVGWFGRMALKHVYYHMWNESPVQVRCRIQVAWGWCTTGKTIALTRWTFVGKVMSLLLNMLSKLVITFLRRSKHLLISWLQSSSAVILEPGKIVSHCFSIYFAMKWWDRMPWS